MRHVYISNLVSQIQQKMQPTPHRHKNSFRVVSSFNQRLLSSRNTIFVICWQCCLVTFVYLEFDITDLAKNAANQHHNKTSQEFCVFSQRLFRFQRNPWVYFDTVRLYDLYISNSISQTQSKMHPIITHHQVSLTFVSSISAPSGPDNIKHILAMVSCDICIFRDWCIILRHNQKYLRCSCLQPASIHRSNQTCTAPTPQQEFSLCFVCSASARSVFGHILLNIFWQWYLVTFV